MADRKLLKLAAKAAGLRIEGDADKLVVFPGQFAGGFSVFNEKGGSQLWNPLTDDGDALRLAVKLRLIIDPVVKPLDGTYPCAAVLIPGGFNYITESFGDDPCAATRRAIVRAAAEFGKGKESSNG